MLDGARRQAATIREGFATDLVAVVAFVAATAVAVIIPSVRATPVRAPLVFGFVLVLPGYAFVAALFPEGGDASPDSERSLAGGIGLVERFVLSVALSIAIVIVIGVALLLLSVGFVLPIVLATLTGLTLGATVLAAGQRGRLRPTDRYRSPLDRAVESVGSAVRTSPADAALSAVLIVGIVSLGGLVAADITAPTRTTSTDLFVVAPNGTGEPTAADYPTNFTRGESRPLLVGVTNHEQQPSEYTVVVVLQCLDADDGSVVVTEQTRLDRFDLRVAANETVRERRAITPTTTGTRLRLAVLLYRDQPPADPTLENAYREVHLFVTVTER